MSKYGGCTLSFCNWQDRDGYAIEGAIEFSSCEDCPYYDPEFYRELFIHEVENKKVECSNKFKWIDEEE